MTEHEPEASPAETPETTTKTPAPATRQGDSTTMRFQGVGTGHEQVELDGRGLSAEDQATIDALRPGTGLLIVLRGPNTGARFLLDDAEVTTGRHPDSDIFLDDVTVSRKHAVLVHKDDAFFIEDQGSLNGTFLNRRRTESGRLENGDELQIGKYKLSFLEK